jgi:hypothetical protein
MRTFIIRLQDGNYIMNVELSSNYLEYDAPASAAKHIT